MHSDGCIKIKNKFKQVFTWPHENLRNLIIEYNLILLMALPDYQEVENSEQLL